MGIYIKGIKMPTGADELRLIIFPNGQTIISKQTYYEETEAIELPPHGDLIDKKTVSENLVSVLNKKNPPFSYPDWNDAIGAIYSAPTIIEAEGSKDAD